MHSFSLLDTYDPSVNSTGYPYKESILMVSLAGASQLMAAYLCEWSRQSLHTLSPLIEAQLGNDRPGHAPAGQA
jgi:hypothetical protein